MSPAQRDDPVSHVGGALGHPPDRLREKRIRCPYPFRRVRASRSFRIVKEIAFGFRLRIPQADYLGSLHGKNVPEHRPLSMTKPDRRNCSIAPESISGCIPVSSIARSRSSVTSHASRNRVSTTEKNEVGRSPHTMRRPAVGRWQNSRSTPERTPRRRRHPAAAEATSLQKAAPS